MALISIKDLPQSDALDHLAMLSIAGGGRIDVRSFAADAASSRAGRIVDYPPGFGRQGPFPAEYQCADKAN
jgi:hypothetical protein